MDMTHNDMDDPMTGHLDGIRISDSHEGYMSVKPLYPMFYRIQEFIEC